jgi:hypothetical protein
MLTCIRIGHICLTHTHLLQGAQHLLLHCVVCPLPFYTSRRNAHVLTKAKRFHCQQMLNGILGGHSHGFILT